MTEPKAFALLTLIVLMGGCAPEGATPEEEAAMATLANGSFDATLEGIDIHYEVHGDGPVVMTVPNSWGIDVQGLRSLYRPLEERLTMVYFDPRGMGGSGPIRDEADMGLAAVRADFDALRRHLGLERVHAIGWSNGAGNLILLAAERPSTLETAIFVHGVASFTPEDMAEWAEKNPELMSGYAAFQVEMADESIPVAQKTARMKALWLEEFFPASSADPESAVEMLRELFGGAQFSWPHSAYANKEVPVFDARDKLPAITARSLVVAGAHDSFRPEKVRELHEGLADSEFLIFERSGHFAPAEEPRAFQDAVFSFLGV